VFDAKSHALSHPNYSCAWALAQRRWCPSIAALSRDGLIML
jgi:hypothetical protein